ncbi:hypothetical protein [Actinomadura rubrisoli]|uniref:Uncharacterized protein n=1 Tax=Actinomadura rubrisoli TaxID=2530368 RepID=A0A4V2YZ22_9ACTN|nr:hypothetical protein [Actinomadura rubrisoli]TDD95297.1 hypothetical protein E1298_05375 [Actinomadura rubrisoli]
MTKAGPLAPLLTALLQRDPTARATASQTAEMLDRVAFGDPSPAEASHRRSTKRHVLYAGIAAVVAVGVCVAVALGVPVVPGTKRSSNSSGAAAPSPTPSPLLGPSGLPTGPPTTPVGFQIYRDDKLGYSVAVPADWKISWDAKNETRDFYSDEGESIWVGLNEIDPLGEVFSVEELLKNDSNYSQYRRLRLSPVAYGPAVVDLEYSHYNESTKASYHCLFRAFSLTTKAYSVYMCTPLDDWDHSRDTFAAFYETFRPN